MIKKEEDLLELQDEIKEKKSEVEYSQLEDTSLGTINDIQKLFPQWKRLSVIKKMKKTQQGRDLRFVATLNGEIIAHVKYEKKQGIHNHIMKITSLVVDKKHRRKGIASKLMKNSMKHLPKKIKILTLAVDSKNKVAIGLYKKLGFKKYGLLKKASLIKGKYVDNHMMKKDI